MSVSEKCRRGNIERVVILYRIVIRFNNVNI